MTSLDEITSKNTAIPEWLDQQFIAELTATQLSSIRNLHIEPAISAGENFMTQLLRVQCNVEHTADEVSQHSFILKVLPESADLQRELHTWRVFEKEQSVYTEYIPVFEESYRRAACEVTFGPKFITVSQQRVPEQFIVLEDLRKLGFQNVRRQNGLDLAHMKAALTIIAQFHAASACHYKSNGSYPNIFDRSLCSEQDNYAEYRQQVARTIRNCLPLYGHEELGEKITTYAAVAPDQYQSTTLHDPDEFCVLNHGDFWVNNIMFRYDEQGHLCETRLIDFQMTRYGSPAHDLWYLLLTSTPLEYKLSHFDYFVSFYHAMLTKYLKLLGYPSKIPSLREIHIGLFRRGDWAFTIFSTVLPVVLLDPSEDAKGDNLIANTDKAEELRQRMFSNSRFVAHAKQLLPWLNYRGLLNYTTA